jgi:hypothetical protein
VSNYAAPEEWGRMIATAEKLQAYLQAAYDHFSKDLDTPSGFIEGSIEAQLHPRSSGSSTPNLTLSLNMNLAEHIRDNTKIFDEMLLWLRGASCSTLFVKT